MPAMKKLAPSRPPRLAWEGEGLAVANDAVVAAIFAECPRFVAREKVPASYHVHGCTYRRLMVSSARSQLPHSKTRSSIVLDLVSITKNQSTPTTLTAPAP